MYKQPNLPTRISYPTMSLIAVPDEAVEVGTFYNLNQTSYETPFLSSWDYIKHAKTLEII